MIYFFLGVLTTIVIEIVALAVWFVIGIIKMENE